MTGENHRVDHHKGAASRDNADSQYYSQLDLKDLQRAYYSHRFYMKMNSRKLQLLREKSYESYPYWQRQLSINYGIFKDIF